MCIAVVACRFDVIFVIDETRRRRRFENMKSFVSDLVGEMDIDSGHTRVGIVTYSDTVNTQIDLNDYTTTASLQSAIDALSRTGDGTNTVAALDRVRTSMLTAAAGDRSDVPNIVVVLTDGQSSTEADLQVRVKRS